MKSANPTQDPDEKCLLIMGWDMGDGNLFTFYA